MNRRAIQYSLLHICLPLILGLMLYLLLRPDAALTLRFESLTGISLAPLRNELPASAVLRFLRSYLADFLWAYTFAAALLPLGNYWKFRERDMVVLCLFTAFFLEFIQIFLPNFTFDPVDIAVEAAGTLLGWMSFHRVRKKL